jgi:hypothetical protein
MKRSVFAMLGLVTVGLAADAHAQGNAAAPEAPPRGPAEIFQRTGEARDARERKRATQLGQPPASEAPAQPAPHDAPAVPSKLPPGHPSIADSADMQGAPSELPPGHPSIADSADMQGAPSELPPGHPSVADSAGEAGQPPVGEDPHAHAEGAPPLARRPLASAEPSSSVPVGTIRVRVVDAGERPVADADLQLGIMAQEKGRTALAAKSGGDGQHLFENLATGDKQAYRVNVLYQGAKYSSTPFRLPDDRGYDVTVRRLDTTHEERDLVLYVGATSIELKDERLKIVQQARLVNIGSKTYVFPEAGQLVKLPSEALAFQTEEVMTDQHVREDKGKGVRISGSVPPGEVTLTWGFDLPQDGSSVDLTFDLPWVTFAYRVLADAAPGMTLAVDGMPAPELHEDNGRHFYVTEVVKRVGEPPMRGLNIHVKGIPGPGPGRFIASALALMILGVGVYAALRTGRQQRAAASPLRDLAWQRERLIERAAELEAERARGEIGPEFHATVLRDLEDELAAVLYEQKHTAAGPSDKRDHAAS